MAKFLLLLLLIQIAKTRCSQCWDVIRDDRDRFTDCSTNGYCSCPESHKTFVYNSNNCTAGKCVKDENIIPISQPEALQHLTIPKDGKCLEVDKDDKIQTLDCKNELSYQWLWHDNKHLLNLRTLKCLQQNQNENLSINPCRKNNASQQWRSHVSFWTNDGQVDRQIRITCRDLTDDNCDYNLKYKGCYQYSDGKFVQLVNNSDCGTSKEKSCSVTLNISAPIFGRIRRDEKDINTCKLQRDNARSSSDGHKWDTFSGTKQFSLKNTLTGVILKIGNKTSLLEKWSGHLIKLQIKCDDNARAVEEHCVLLKIASSVQKIPNEKMCKTTSRSRPSTSEPAATSKIIPGSSSNSTIIIVSAVVFLCLLVAAIVIVLLYRRRKRSASKRNNVHLHEESNPLRNAPTQISAGQSGDLPRLSNANAYECPGNAIASERQYEYPNFGPHAAPENRGAPLMYDYATREEMPLISPEDLRTGNITAFMDATELREKEDQNKNLHTLENGDGTTDGDDDDVVQRELKKNPVYNELEEPESNGPKAGNNNNLAEKNAGPVYNVLEEPQSDGSKARSDENGIEKNPAPVYNVLEEP